MSTTEMFRRLDELSDKLWLEPGGIKYLEAIEAIRISYKSYKKKVKKLANRIGS